MKHKPPRVLRLCAYWAISFTVGLLVCLLVLEGVLRILNLDTRSGNGADPVSAEFMASIQGSINSQGFRDPERDSRELASHYKIIAIGDSYTFGSGIKEVEDRYTNLLAKRLGVPVVNLGRRGMNFPGHARLGRSAIDALHPEGIILQFTMNDAGHFGMGKGCVAPAHWNLPESWRRLERQSYLVSRLNRGYTALRNGYDSDAAYEHYLECLYDDPAASGYREFFAAVKHVLQEWKQESRFVLLLVWPYYTETNPYPFSHVHRELREIAAASQVLFVDLSEFSGDVPVQSLMVGAHDPHPNERAHAIAAEAIAATLAREHIDVGQKQ